MLPVLGKEMGRSFRCEGRLWERGESNKIKHNLVIKEDFIPHRKINVYNFQDEMVKLQKFCNMFLRNPVMNVQGNFRIMRHFHIVSLKHGVTCPGDTGHYFPWLFGVPKLISVVQYLLEEGSSLTCCCSVL